SGGTTIGTGDGPNTSNRYENNAVDTAFYGIAVVGPTGNETDTEIIGNTVGSSVAANKVGGNGIALFQQSNATVSGNTISGLSTTTALTNTVSGIYVGGTANNLSIASNIIRNIRQPNTSGWGSNGIQLASSSTAANVTVSNNFISDIASQGFNGVASADNGYGIVIDSGAGYRIYNNSVSLATNQVSATGRPAAINIAAAVTTSGGLDIRNNIFANSQTVGTRYGIINSSTAGAAIFSTINYNDYFAQHAGATVSGTTVTNRTTLANWQAASTQDANSISANPQFTSVTDLHILRASPAYTLSPVENVGVPIGSVLTDADGDTRDGTTPDIGADEVISVQLSAASYSVAENVGGGVATVTVTRTAGAAGASSVAYGTADNTAVGGATCSGSTDYVSASGTLNFAAGETSKTFDVTICNDGVYENDDVFDVTLSTATGATLGAPAIGSVAITNDDTAPTASINDVEFPADSLVDTKFTVTLSVASGATTTVPYSSGGGTATGGTGCASGDDYVAVSGTLPFAPGVTVQEIPITICADTVQEPTETFNLTLGTPTGATILDGVGVGTISSADVSTASISNGSLNEGDTGMSNMTFAVSLTNTNSVNTTINYSLSNGTATSGSDFDGTSGSITINAGDNSGTISIPINGDTLYEADETFTVTITSPDVAIGTGTANGTITNDDAPPATVVVNSTADTDDGFCLALGEGNGCTLREAINAANANSDATTINFGIPGVGPHIIQPTSFYPQVSYQIFLEGYSQSGAQPNTLPVGNNAVIKIQIDGSLAGPGVTGLALGGNGSIVRGLSVVNFSETGIFMGFGGSSHTIEGNFVGIDVDGTTTKPNLGNGVASDTGNHVIGGTTQASRNVISGNGQSGVALYGINSQNSFVYNNYVGTDASGMVDKGNSAVGVAIQLGSTGNLIGSSDPNSRNVISGNSGIGVRIVDSGTANNAVKGNYIGVGADGLVAIGNGAEGVAIGGSVGVSGNVIGGIMPGEGNIIANSGLDGVNVDGVGAINNSIRGNSIYNSSNLLGIGLGGDGVTANDPSDTDVGPNNFQNYPVISSVEVTGSTKHIMGTLNSTPSSTFAIDVYSNVTCDGTGYGEGQTYVGSFNVTTDINGDVNFDITSLSPAVGSFLTATATDPSGNTSEFSACTPVVSGTAGTLQFSSPTYSVGESGGTVTITVNRNGGTDGSVSATLSAINGTATSPGDFGPFTTTTVTFPDGDSTPQTFVITINEDAIYELNEEFDVALSATSINLVGETATVAITDNDAAPTISVDSVTLAEGNAGTTNFNYTLTKTGLTEVNATVSYATADVTATSTLDYAPITATPVTFLPAETTQTFSVTVYGDSTYETNETFAVNLSTAVNAVLGSNGTGTITNDDAQPQLSIADATYTGDSVGGTLSFAVSLTGATEVWPVTVAYSTADDTATQPDDYSLTSGTLTFNSNASQNVVVNISGDNTQEPTEQFFVNLNAPTNATISDNQAVGTINNDDNASASITDVTANETNSGTTTFSFPVNLDKPVSTAVTINYSTANASASSPTDFAGVGSGSIIIPANTTTGSIDITVNGDATFESNEMFTVTITSSQVTIGTGTATGTITNDDSAPVINSNSVTLAEGSGGGTTSFSFELTKVGNTELNATVNWATAFATATAADFTAVPSTPITFLPGETTKQVTVLVNADVIYETNEIFALDVSGGTNATAGTDGVGTITNDDSQPTIAVNDVEFVGQSVTDTKFTITLTGASEVTATVNYDTNDVTATRGATCAAPADYQRATGTLTFLAGESTKEVTVSICPDTIVEPTETFTFDLSSASQATISDGQGIGTISSDDASSASIAGVTANEGNAGTSTFTFPVTLTNPVSTAVTINYSTADVSANDGSDYVGVTSGSIIIPALSTGGNINITVNGDQNFEPTETFTVTITSPDVSIGTGTATGTITNDDTVPTLAFSSATYSGTEGSSATITVNRTGAVGDAVSVQYATSNGSANSGVCGSGGDYVSSSGTLNFAANELSKTFAVVLCNDLVIETGETVNLTLTSPGGGAVLGLSSAVLTINNAGTGTTAISGNITKFTGGGGLENVTVTLSNGSSTLTTSTNASGAYSFSGLPDNDNYSITPSCPSNPTCLGYVFDPSSREYLNLSGSVTNANFVGYLNDNPRDVSVVSTQQTTYASNVTVPITVASRGNENSFLFTLNFDPSLLQYSSVSCGAAPPAGCTAFGSPGVGSVAISVDLDPGVTFATGLRQVALVTFTTTPGTAFNTPVTFASSPRSVNNVDGIEVPADYVNGTVIFAQGLEGDVAGCPSSPNCIGVPANSGYPDGLVNSGDLTRLRRLVAGMSVANSLINEFQRADIAPFIGRGDGRLTSGDVTVMRRYITGDLSTVRLPASGPIAAAPFADLPLDPTGQRDETDRETPFRVVGSSATHGENVTIAVELDQRGVENSYSYTLNFDPARLSIANGGVRLDAMSMLGGGVLTVNYDDAANGNIGILFDMPAGQVIASGATRHTVLLSFYVPKRAPLGEASIIFTDGVSERYLSNASGDPLRYKFVPGVVSIGRSAR
ncbi:MAG TPA: Calx-beta domain-containing protein, partial [Pyrinomonadaceae bacterium]|nr:Calx-beta domain-containing protein [Pyrinomonadaceae bacterium]